MVCAIRPSSPADVAAVREIYAHHVLHGLGSLEETPPDLAELARRREEVLGRGLPHMVAEAEGRVVGYAYAGPYRPRPAYRCTVEDSVYVAPDHLGRGVGRALLGHTIVMRAGGEHARLSARGRCGHGCYSGCPRWLRRLSRPHRHPGSTADCSMPSMAG